VVSARRGDELNAMTVRMATQVSTRPPCLALSIRKRSLTYEFIQSSEVFAVSILAQGQELLGGHFGLRSGRAVHKFVALEHHFGITGAPILDNCSAWMECRVCAMNEIGSQMLVIGEVLAAGVGTQSPLVYRESDYYEIS
jgi:flavin reductase (DIM6/NTAB) family NADH-FMN oxidoreductase RutF